MLARMLAIFGIVWMSVGMDQAIAGRAIVIHAQPDDLSSQPSGNAGARVACGVIELEDRDS